MNWHVPAPAARVAVHQPAFDVISHPVSENGTSSISRTASRIWLLVIAATAPAGATEQVFSLLSSLLPVSLQSLPGAAAG